MRRPADGEIEFRPSEGSGSDVVVKRRNSVKHHVPIALEDPLWSS